ncbi:DsbA family protein [Tessaracoccus sp. Z1128]
MANNSSLSKRAALRQQQELEERNKRTRRILTVGAVLVAVTVVAVLAIVIVQALGRTTTVAEEQLTPPNATDSLGILLAAKAPQEGTPHLVVWEDFQCPACAAREESYGPVIEQLVADGEITAEIRTAFFLDAGLRNDSSKRAALAAAAADEVGAFDAFHRVVYANHPATEGTGFTEQQLRVDFPALAGIEGEDLTRYQQLYDTRAYNDFTDEANQKFNDDRIGATPTFLVSGQVLEFYDSESKSVLIQPTADSMMEAIGAAYEAGGQQTDS